MEEICAQCCDDDIRMTLDNLPRNLEETFNRVLQRILSQNQNVPFAQRVFPWIAVAKRNLHIEEVLELLCVEVGKRALNQGQRISSPDRLILWCGNLIQVNEEDSSICFTHRTIFEFIIGKPSRPNLDRFHVDVEQAGHNAGEVCVTYLHLDEFQTTLAQRAAQRSIQPMDIPSKVLAHKGLVKQIAKRAIPRGSDQDGTREYDIAHLASFGRAQPNDFLNSKYPFLKYASEHWISHTSSFEEGVSVTWRSWTRLVLGNENSLCHRPWDHQGSRSIIDWGVSGRHKSILRLVAESDPDHVTALLLKGAENGDGWSLDLLLQDARPTDASTLHDLLATACRCGHTKIVRRLLPEISPLGPFRRIDSPLCLASTHGNLGVVHLLLSPTAGIYKKDKDEINLCLLAAIVWGHMEVVKLLVTYGADLNTVNKTKNKLENLHGSANFMVEYDDAQVRKNLEKDLQGPQLDEYLQATLQEDLLKKARRDKRLQAELHKFLESMGQGAGEQTPYPWYLSRALYIAACDGDLHIVRWLLSSLEGQETPYYMGTLREHLTLLVRRALDFDNLEAVDLFLAAGADPNASLWGACENGHFQFLDRLIAGGADVKSGHKQHIVPIKVASLNGHVEVVKRLLEAGASVNVVPGSSPLHCAVLKGHLSVVKLLVFWGVDLHQSAYIEGRHTTAIDLARKRFQHAVDGPERKTYSRIIIELERAGTQRYSSSD